MRPGRGTGRLPAGILAASVAASLLGGAVPGGAGTAPRTGSGPPAGDPWAARAALEHAGAFEAGGGAWVSLDAVSRAAVPGELETTAAAGWERGFGPGVAVRWRRWWRASGGAGNDLGAAAVFRSPGWRIALGAGGTAALGRRRERVTLVVHRQAASVLLAGLRVAADPEAPAAAPEVVASLHAARGAWRAGLELGPGPGALRVALGLAVSADFTWTAAYAGGAPTLGAAWGFGSLALRGESRPDPWLGAVNRVRVSFQGGGR